MNVLLQGFGGTEGRHPYASDRNGYGADDRPVNRYLTGEQNLHPKTEMDVFRCPSDNASALGPDSSEYRMLGNSYFLNYTVSNTYAGMGLWPQDSCMNWIRTVAPSIFADKSWLLVPKHAVSTSPARFVLLGDNGYPGAALNLPWYLNWHGGDDVNGRNFNFLFLDGHTAIVQMVRGGYKGEHWSLERRKEEAVP